MKIPADESAEMGSLGAVIQDGTLATRLNPEWFFRDDLRTVAGVLIDLAGCKHPITEVTTADALKGKVENPVALVCDLANACHSPANFDYWREALEDKRLLRAMIETGQKAISDAQLADAKQMTAQDALDGLETAALAIRTANPQQEGELDLRSVLLELANDYEASASHQGPRGLLTGFRGIDRMTGGLKPGWFVVLAARPAMGKTSLAMNIVENIAIEKKLPVGVFSLEMTGRELLHRLACCRARIDSRAAEEGRVTEGDIHRLTTAMGALRRAPIRLCDKGGLSVGQIRAQARRWQREGIKLLVLDYLGLVRSTDRGRSRYESVTEISAALKALSKEIGVPLLCLAQLNRAVESDERKPRCSDLRDSGSVEQDADLIGLLHRPEDSVGNDCEVELLISKNRHGPTGIVKLRFNRSLTHFYEPTENDV